MKKVSRHALVAGSVLLLVGAAVLWGWPDFPHGAGRPEYVPGMETSMHHTSMESMVRDAKTPKDREALAQHYVSAALRLEDDASRHERSAVFYVSPVAGQGPLQSLATHCLNVAKNLRAAAAEDRELARLHREIARTAK